MKDSEKVIEYEIHIEYMLKTLQEKLSEFGDAEEMSEIEQGRQLAYTEMLDIIQTRHRMILAVIEESK